MTAEQITHWLELAGLAITGLTGLSGLLMILILRWHKFIKELKADNAESSEVIGQLVGAIEDTNGVGIKGAVAARMPEMKPGAAAKLQKAVDVQSGKTNPKGIAP